MGGASVALTVLSYEFDDEQRDYWDRNWLVVRGDVRTADGLRWTFHEPCLTTWEAASLGEWLRWLATDGPAEPELHFVEPLLTIESSKELDGTAGISIHLANEAGRPVAGDRVEVVVAGPVTRPDLVTASTAWSAELARFPVR